MKKKMCIIIVAIVGVLAVIYGIITKTKAAASISIIGGADGPTSIFLAGKIGDGFSLTIIVVGAVILVAALLLFLRKRK
jgi:LPXTG-motif cell wall-anchored protein